jgi:hypothetical protein
MNMKNLNVFRRLDELETDNLYLRTMLKNLRMEVDRLKALMHLQVKPKAKPGPKPGLKAVKSKETLDKAAEKKRAYAKAYYAKKKAEKLAVAV